MRDACELTPPDAAPCYHQKGGRTRCAVVLVWRVRRGAGGGRLRVL